MRETVYQTNQWKTTEEQAFVIVQLSSAEIQHPDKEISYKNLSE